MNNNKGIAPIIIILFLALVIAGGIYWYINIYLPGISAYSAPSATETKYIKKTQVQESSPQKETTEFEELSEDESTPDEINNDVLNELDEIILSIEGNEDISDL